MARDYKHVRRAPERRRGAPGWLWASAGLAVGLFVAFLVYLDSHRGPVVVLPPAPAPALPRESGPAREPAGPSVQAAPNPGESRFQFYHMLPEMQVPAGPAPHAAAPVPAPAAPTAPARATGEGYMLQVGAFRTYQEADRLKASLVLLGLDVTIQTVSQDGKAPMHRVRVGPFTDASALNEARRRLKQQSLEPIVVKGKT